MARMLEAIIMAEKSLRVKYLGLCEHGIRWYCFYLHSVMDEILLRQLQRPEGRKSLALNKHGKLGDSPELTVYTV